MNERQVIICPKCKGQGKQGDYTMMIVPPLFLFARFIDWIGGDAPMDITYDPCSKCDGSGWITIGEDRGIVSHGNGNG